ncbi:terpenoid cyclases/protein prenyltransferase alpha-alpha toroid [Podospora appendiculata]|uniref:Terpene cyclase/mutase family member n=1 Tax=Podospora appendiculata TaxID=314037 RepID=A0AAE0X1L1_9PEZI|nr:terpenoid cyclases/protein prenyltransferase alpha-alpha toroid [Podospora appendiculata]
MIVSQAEEAIAKAQKYAWAITEPDGHWYGELRANVTLTAEHVFFYQSMGKHIPDAEQYRRYLLGQQQADGSWTIAPDYPGDVSTTSEAYLALKILGMTPDDPAMHRARTFIRRAGGVEAAAVPQLPAELILLPSHLPLNIYRLSSWARSTIVPLLLIAHHQPIYALPNKTSPTNDYLDELWLNPSSKMVPLGPSILSPLSHHADLLSYFFLALDKALSILNGLRNLPMVRAYARRRCLSWILARQENSGDWAGIIPPMHLGIQALLLEGYSPQSPQVQSGIAAIERFTWHDAKGKRLQSCVSPVWDTVLMVRALADTTTPPSHAGLLRAVKWIKSRQILGPEGDWRVYNPSLSPGGFAFEYHNTWYPDVDDTAAAILALISHSPEAIDSCTVAAAATWILGMQNRDGGWATFDTDNDALWLNKIPFSDMDSLCDPSTADVTGRVIEAFGLIISLAKTGTWHVAPGLLDHLLVASDRAIHYLAHAQEPNGSWYGRWGVNYVYGTSNVLAGLGYFADPGSELVRDMLDSGTAWLVKMQNRDDDGGWGEELMTYRDKARAGRGAPSTPSQTAWGVIGLLVTLPPEHEAVMAGVQCLVRMQTEDRGDGGGSWPEERYTGTGFPNFFYIGYTLYRHYFPMMALGRFVRAVKARGGVVVTNGVKGE